MDQNHRRQIVERVQQSALSKLGDQNFHAFSQICESFADWCNTGEVKCSEQGHLATSRIGTTAGVCVCVKVRCQPLWLGYTMVATSVSAMSVVTLGIVGACGGAWCAQNKIRNGSWLPKKEKKQNQMNSAPSQSF